MKILVLTPIQIEQEAVVGHLSNRREVMVEGTHYVQGEFSGKHHRYEVVCQQTGSGNSVIALATERAVQRFRPAAVFLVGVAAGMKDVNIGDVVVGTKYYGYEFSKESDHGSRPRPWSSHYSKTLRELAKSVIAQQDWWKQLPGNLVPNVVFGPIASGNKVVAGKASPVYRFIQQHYNDTTALEMEAAGFGEAMSEYPHILSMNVRGISDLVEGKEQADRAGSQALAAGHAAAFVFALIKQLELAHSSSMEMEVRNRLDDFMELLQKAQAPSILAKHREEGYDPPPNRAPRELERLQPLSKEDRAYISDALDQLGDDEKARKLKFKLDSLFDFQQLGLSALAQPAIERYKRLDQAKADRRQVILEGYRSNSNEIRDRRVEPFKINAELDTLEAFDVEAEDNRHFRLSRIKRVRSTEEPWQFAQRHVVKFIDAFRIADNEMERVHLRLDVLAYNLLTETYPKTKTHLHHGAEPNTWVFEGEVNHHFYGLINFIMGNAKHVEVIGPESLKERMREEARKILKKLEE